MQNKNPLPSSEILNQIRSIHRARSGEDSTSGGLYTQDMTTKVMEDIHFLRDRIAHIKRSRMSTPNPVILQTYQSMLESRESVLAWLNENNISSEHSQAS